MDQRGEGLQRGRTRTSAGQAGGHMAATYLAVRTRGCGPKPVLASPERTERSHHGQEWSYARSRRLPHEGSEGKGAGNPRPTRCPALPRQSSASFTRTPVTVTPEALLPARHPPHTHTSAHTLRHSQVGNGLLPRVVSRGCGGCQPFLLRSVGAPHCRCQEVMRLPPVPSLTLVG